MAKSYKCTALEQTAALKFLRWAVETLPEWTSNPSGHWNNLGRKTGRTTSQPTCQTTSQPSSVNVTGWGWGLPQNQGEKRQPEYTGSQQIMLGQGPGRKGWWDGWKLPSSTRLRSFRYKWRSKRLWGQSGGKMTVLQEERRKDRLP